MKDRRTIAKINEEKNFVILVGTYGTRYAVSKSLCTDNQCAVGDEVEITTDRGGNIVSFCVVTDDMRKAEKLQEEEAKQRELEKKKRMEELKFAKQNYWNSLPEFDAFDACETEIMQDKKVSVEYLGSDLFGNKIPNSIKDMLDIYYKCEFAFYMFYENGKFVVAYSNRNDMQEGVMDIKKYPYKTMTRTETYEKKEINANLSGMSNKEYCCYYDELVEQYGLKTVKRTREVEYLDRSEMTFYLFDRLLYEIKESNDFLVVDCKDFWIEQSFTPKHRNLKSAYQIFQERKPLTLYMEEYDNTKAIYNNISDIRKRMCGYPECIEGVKLDVYGNQLTIRREQGLGVAEFCEKYQEKNLAADVFSWKKINQLYGMINVPELTGKQFFELIEMGIKNGTGFKRFACHQDKLVYDICNVVPVQICSISVSDINYYGKVKKTAKLWCHTLDCVKASDIGNCFNQIKEYNQSIQIDFTDFEVKEEIETSSGKEIVKIKLNRGKTYSLGQVALYDKQMGKFLTDNRKNKMAKLYENEMCLKYEEQWKHVLENIYDNEIASICREIMANAPDKCPDAAGFELELKGEIVAEAEVAWVDRKVALITQEQLDCRKQFEENGWRVICAGEGIKTVLENIS